MVREFTRRAKSLSLSKKRRQAVLALTILTGAAGLVNQAEIQEPHWIATRSFVRDSVALAASKVEGRQIQTQLYLAKSERSRLENEIANKQVILTQNPTMVQAARSAIEEQIRALATELEAAKITYENLRREQSLRQ